MSAKYSAHRFRKKESKTGSETLPQLQRTRAETIQLMHRLIGQTDGSPPFAIIAMHRLCGCAHIGCPGSRVIVWTDISTRLPGNSFDDLHQVHIGVRRHNDVSLEAVRKPASAAVVWLWSGYRSTGLSSFAAIDCRGIPSRSQVGSQAGRRRAGRTTIEARGDSGQVDSQLQGLPDLKVGVGRFIIHRHDSRG